MKKQRWIALAKMLSAILCAVLLAVGLNFLDQAGVKVDLTEEKLTSLSEGTLQTLQSMQEEVHFYLVFAESTDNDLRLELETLSDSYARNGRVTVDTIDPVKEPARISPFQTTGQSISEGSVIVCNADSSRYQVVSAGDMYTYTVTTNGVRKRTGIAAEQKLTAALRSVIGSEGRTVYFLSGHQEATVEDCSMLAERLQDEGYEVAELTLREDGLEQDCVLMILSPMLDLTDEEYEVISAWLDVGGRMFFACDATLDMDTMPHFNSLAGRFSLTFESGIVVESGTAANYYVSSPLYLMPEINRDAEAASGLSTSGRVLVPGCRAVSGPSIPLSGYTYQTLLSTSDESYIKRTDSNALTREADDPQGAWQLAVSVRHAIEGTDAEMRAVLMGSLYTVVDNSLLSSTSNLDLTVATVGYLAQREDAVSVPVREVWDTSMAVPSAGTAMVILGITLCLPVLAILTCVTVVVRRRRK